MKKSDHVLPDCYDKTYKKMLEDLANCLDDKYKDRPLTAFWPIKGECYEKGQGLMVIGRAVNGWSVKGRPEGPVGEGWCAEELESEQTRKNLVLGIRRLSESLSSDGWKICDEKVNIRPKLKIKERRSNCPMSWVVEKAGSKNGGYNTNRSAFWRVSKKVLEALYPEKVSEERWSSHLCWSNLYKIAPLKTGNPLKSSKNIQKRHCTKLLEIELKVYNPKYVLVVAGNEWYEPFINCLGIEVDGVSEDKPVGKDKSVEKSGRINDRVWVFAKHPQGRSQERFVCEVHKAFRKLETS